MADDTTPSLKRVTVIFEGHVQGVGFRYTAQRIARRFKVVGYVQNLPDRTVKLIAEGERKVLERFIGEVVYLQEQFIRSHKADYTPATGEFGEPGKGQFKVEY